MGRFLLTLLLVRGPPNRWRRCRRSIIIIVIFVVNISPRFSSKFCRGPKNFRIRLLRLLLFPTLRTPFPTLRTYTLLIRFLLLPQCLKRSKHVRAVNHQRSLISPASSTHHDYQLRDKTVNSQKFQGLNSKFVRIVWTKNEDDDKFLGFQ